MPDARYRAARLLTALAIGTLYFWIIGIGAVDKRFAWDSGSDAFYALRAHKSVQGSDTVNGYYDLLGRAFANGTLHLPVEPPAELLALADPWSDLTNRPYRLLDAVLYKRHYYLYHGATPALLLFTPWYLITRHDLPENFAVFLLSLAGYLFLAALFARVVSSLSIRLPLTLYILFLIALGVGQSVPFLLHRVKVYEVAIACGYFCLSAGFYFIFRRLTSSDRQALWAALSGVSFGLAIGARPHLGVAAVSVFFLLLFLPKPVTYLGRRFIRKDVLAFIIPVIACGLLVVAYNYARFDNPLEFGTRYLLGGDTYRNFSLSTANFVRGLYYLLICPPDLVPEFPFVRLALRDPFHAVSMGNAPRYFLEPIGGVLSLCPLTLLVLMLPFWRQLRITHPMILGFLAAMLACAAGSILVLSAVPFSSHRYEVDFLPYLLFIACVVAAGLLRNVRRDGVRIVATIGVAASLLYCVTANLALGIQGPYDQFVQARPDTYVKLARWFSPVARYRPLLDPMLHVRGMFEFHECPPQREPLLSAGEFGSRYLLSAECAGPVTIRLVSQTSVRNPDERNVELPFDSKGSYEIGLDFTPNDHMMTVTWNHKIALQHPLRFLVTSRSQVHFGWDATLGNRETFNGNILYAPSWVLETGLAR